VIKTPLFEVFPWWLVDGCKFLTQRADRID
jgi:hypothetical protein